MTVSDGFIIGTAVVVSAWLFSPQVRRSLTWQATVTPLASIIGSGFLVAAPLVAVIVGKSAPLVMAAIVLFAFFIGGIIRFNIRNLDPFGTGKEPIPPQVLKVERLSGIALSIAYVVSVAFYLRLLASFLFHGLDQNVDLYANLLTTAILAFIGIVGFTRGLHALERMEMYSVTIKLAIISALIMGLGIFDVHAASQIFTNDIPTVDQDTFHKLRQLAGLLLIVQGFETSRYLGSDYSASIRINTMRQAQFISGVIYVVFVILSMPLLTHLAGTSPDETAIIELSKLVSPVLPIMLIVAAVMSQFSAAVADTVGGGGLLAENTGEKFGARKSYLFITVAAIAMVWVVDIFQIISIASRAFALYYLLQGIVAWLLVGKYRSGWQYRLEKIRFGALIFILALIVIFGHAAHG